MRGSEVFPRHDHALRGIASYPPLNARSPWLRTDLIAPPAGTTGQSGSSFAQLNAHSSLTGLQYRITGARAGGCVAPTFRAEPTVSDGKYLVTASRSSETAVYPPRSGQD